MHHLFSAFGILLEHTDLAIYDHKKPLGPFSREKQNLSLLEVKFHSPPGKFREFLGVQAAEQLCTLQGLDFFDLHG